MTKALLPGTRLWVRRSCVPHRKAYSTLCFFGLLIPSVGTFQRVEKLLHAPFCVPFKDLKPLLCSVLALVPKCFDSVLGSRPVGHRLFQQAHSLCYKKKAGWVAP